MNCLESQGSEKGAREMKEMLKYWFCGIVGFWGVIYLMALI